MRPDLLQTYDDDVRAVYGYLAYRAIPAAEVEALTRATFERALSEPEQLDGEETARRRWLLGIARDAYVEHRRSDGTPPDAAATHSDDPERDLSAELAVAIRGLSQREREVVALRFGGEMLPDEIAEFLDIDVAAAKRALARALRRLGDADPAQRSSHS